MECATKSCGTKIAKDLTNYEGIWSELKKGLYILLFVSLSLAIFLLPTLAMFLLIRLTLTVSMMTVFYLMVKLGIYILKSMMVSTSKENWNLILKRKMKAMKEAAVAS